MSSATQKAEGKPTKSLILDALTADIELADAIVDLIDNSVDGIQRVPTDQRKWNDYVIDVKFDAKRFEIVDNCGGIDAATARDYAFRFGRPKGRSPEPGLLGIYGVGMKRAIFKMGDKFSVASSTAQSRFKIDQDLKTWRSDDEDWTFPFAKFDEHVTVPKDEIGTEIVIKELFPEIAEEFKDPQFESNLLKKAAKAHRKRLAEGLRLNINNTPLQAAGFQLLNSDQIRSAFWSHKYNGKAEPVHVHLYAGVAESNPKEAGWYVFCNGRMVVEADQTSRTVWGETGDVSIPKIHNQFARFRGYAFFDCNDQQRLPWTSTKSGINASSPIYRAVRQKMVETTRPVITFLNDLDREKDAESQPRHTAVRAAKTYALIELQGPNASFAYSGARGIGTEIARISYQRPKDRVDRAKKELGVGSNKEVGQETFDYWYRYEVGKK